MDFPTSDTDPPVLHHALIHDDVPHVLLYGVEVRTLDDRQPLAFREHMKWLAKGFGLILPGEGNQLPRPGPSVHVSPTDPDNIVLVGQSRPLPLTRWQDGNDAWRELAHRVRAVQIVCALDPIAVAADAQDWQIHADRGIDDVVARKILNASAVAAGRRQAPVRRLG